MESNNYRRNRMPLPKQGHFSKQRNQWPYIVRPTNNVNQEILTPYSGNSNFQSHSNTIGNIHEINVASNYGKRNYHNFVNKCFKTNYRHRELPYDKHKRQYYPTENSSGLQLFGQEPRLQIYSETPTEEISPIPESPREAKTIQLINAVKSQEGVNGLLVFLQTTGDSAPVIIQNAIQSVKNGILSVVSGKQPQTYELKINGEFIAEGEFLNKQAAKNGLCELALDKFRKTCFFISKKKNYEEISTEDLNKAQAESPTFNGMEGSKAHKMMLKMGWGGKGLGINEQGTEKTVAETMTQSVTKEGLGGKSIMTKINNILREFALSTKVTTLAFDPGFTKQERADIHNLAAKLNLKSKSQGNEENRRITITKKIARWDLVKQLLLANCENEAYILTIPSDFVNIWSN
ncbi:uncharacterized protein LOC108916765 [Anoplophora glabripennis]|uniref:uncharacterized protein LOC108916765 n=1 Tax=Anoplophora glabripennis TaxID=217634 RepID=UPI0008756BE7|nr:uncharacterized protein LOC108916765 [Anoplophora glabripennis]